MARKRDWTYERRPRGTSAATPRSPLRGDGTNSDLEYSAAALLGRFEQVTNGADYSFGGFIKQLPAAFGQSEWPADASSTRRAMKRQRAQSLLAPTPGMLNSNPFPASPTLMPLQDEHGEGTADRWDRSPAWANLPPIVIPPPVNLSDCLPGPSGRASPGGSPLGSDPFGLDDGMGVGTPPASRAAEENARVCKAPLRRFSETVRSRSPKARARPRRGVAGILSS